MPFRKIELPIRRRAYLTLWPTRSCCPGGGHKRLTQARLPSARSILRSVLYWPSAKTDQIAAGIQPISVICNRKQMIPAIGRPIVKNWSHGMMGEKEAHVCFL